MKSLIVWLNRIINKHKALKRWKRVVTVLAAIITFATTYALILPAITVERNKVEDVGGMYLEKEADTNDMFEENALEPEGVSIAADHENAVTFAYADDSMTATAIFSTDEVIPAESELVVNLVDPESEEYADLSSRSAKLLDKEFIYDTTTCAFYDFALICNNVDVTPKTGLVDIQIIFHNNTVEHLDDTLFAGRFERLSDDADGFVKVAADNSPEVSDDLSDVKDELVSVNSDESSVVELTDGIITVLSLKGSDLAESDSLVGILAGNVDEVLKAAAAETDAEIPDYSDSREENAQTDSAETNGEEAALEVRTLKATGSDYTVILTYDATSEIPEGAGLTVSEIAQDSKEYKKYLEKTKKAMGLTEEETLPRVAARFFDIKIMVDGKEFTPENGVSVEITYTEPLAENPDTEVSAVHFANKKADAEVIEANAAEIQDGGAATVEFTAESFSVYGVIYTVDFHWEVDGQTYKYSISGGNFVSLKQLIEVLGIVESDNFGNVQTDYGKSGTEEAVKEFVANVENVEFSTPSLMSVNKVEKNTTVGAIVESLGLDIQYSAELTKEQIAEINAQTVEAGDWALISILPFDTEESLTVTMKTGEVFTIRVTDAQGTEWYGAADTRSEGITINLYDYGPDDLDHDSNSPSNPSNLGINQYSDLKFVAYGGSVGTGINNFTGSAPNEYAAQGIVANRLGEDGYPTLNSNHSYQSLAYLFDSSSREGKTVYSDVNKLLWAYGDGYQYDSNARYAYFDTDITQNPDKEFTLYTGTYLEEGADQQNPFKIGFFPFNDYDDDYHCIHGKEFNWQNCAANRNYNTRYQIGHYNHHFGMTMEATFVYDSSKDMTFGFSGDDDMWVFVDDVLVLDIGGIHNPIDGAINFKGSNGEGSVSVTAPSDNHDARKAVEGLSIAPDTIAKAFQNVGKTWDNSEGSYHEIKVFYLERGGMYSNLELTINLPVVPSGNVSLDKKNNDNEALEGAEFTLYKDPTCEDPLSFKSEDAMAVSNENGVITFSGIPVGTYYMKETGTPVGYEENPTIYKVTVVGKNDTVNHSRIEKLDGTPVTEIINDKHQIQLSLEKEWIGGEPDGATATFRLRRIKTYKRPAEVTLNVYRVKAINPGDDNDFSDLEFDFASLDRRHTGTYAGNQTVVVNWHYDPGMGDEWKTGAYSINGGEIQYPDSSNITTSQTYMWGGYRDDTYVSLPVALPSYGVVNLYIGDGNMGGSYSQYRVSVTSVNGTPPSDDPSTYVTATEVDDSFTGEGLEKTLPDTQTGWSWTFPAQDSAALVNGVVETYYYRIEEEGSTPGYETVYLDGDGNVIPKTDLSPLNMNEDGTQTICNIKKTNVPIDKTWGDAEGSEYTWTATFELEEREVHESGPTCSDANTTHWRKVTGRDPKTISSGNNEQARSFSDLPMYRRYPNGAVYRIMYSVDETAYELKKNGVTVSKWDNENGVTVGRFYSPQFPHDAGDADDESGIGPDSNLFYHVLVENHISNVTVTENLTNLHLQKTWDPDDLEEAGVAEKDAYAEFQLLRYETRKFRTYNEDDTSYTESSGWTVAAEDVGFTKERHIYTLTKDDNNWTQIINNLPREAVSDIQNHEQTVYHYTYYFVEMDCYPTDFAVTFTNDVGDINHQIGQSNQTVVAVNKPIPPFYVQKVWDTVPDASGYPAVKFDLYQVLGNNVSGAAIFTDGSGTSYSGITLDAGNHWTWKCPVVLPTEVSGQTASYYAVENPSAGSSGSIKWKINGYSRNYNSETEQYEADADGTHPAEVRITGNEGTLFIHNLPVEAVTIYKTDVENLNSEEFQPLPGAIFKIKRYKTADYQELDDTWTEPVIDDTVARTGTFQFTNLPAGYYKIEEAKYPGGYIKTIDGIKFRIEMNETTSRLEVQLENAANTVSSPDGRSVLIGNTPGAALPNTGGPGTTITYLIGLLLTGIGAVLVMLRKRRYSL